MARDVTAAARSSSHGVVVMFSHGTVCKCRGWALVTARSSCLVTGPYVNAAGGLSDHGAAACSVTARDVNAAIGLPIHGELFLFGRGTVF